MWKHTLLFALMVTTTMALPLLPIMGTTDKTLQEMTKGEDVVAAVVDKIHASNIFPNDYDLLTRIAYVESKFGESANTYRGIYSGGIWQVDEAVYKETTNTTLLKEKHDKIETYFKINWPTKTTWNDLLKPLYSGLATRLLISIIEDQNHPIPQTIAEQAEYWKLHYNRRNDTHESNFTDAVKELEEKTSSCKGKMDLLVLLDGSGSVGQSAFEQSLVFVADLFDSYSSQNVRKGFMEFSSDIIEVFNLENKLSDSEIRSKVLETRYLKQSTNTNMGILASVDMYKKTPDRPGVPKVFTVFTDGASNQGGTMNKGGIPDIVKAKEANLITFAIGIGPGINQQELNEIAYGDTSHVFTLNNFNALTEFFPRLNRETCEIPQTPAFNENISELIEENDKMYYSLVPPTEGLTISIVNVIGNVAGYYSYSIKTPSSALNDGILKENTFIPPPKNLEENLFVVVKGLEKSNNYTMKIVKGKSSGALDLIPGFIGNDVISGLALL